MQRRQTSAANAAVPALAGTVSLAELVSMGDSQALGVSHASSEASAGATEQPWCVTLSMSPPALDRRRERRLANPPVPERYFKRAKKKIEGGHYGFAVDQAKKVP